MSESERKDNAEQAEFRSYCQEWIAKNHPGEPSVRLPLSPLEIMTPEQMAYLQSWQKSAYDAGLVGCDYPVEVGGGGRGDCQRVANEELVAARTPYYPNVIGLGMAAPTVFHHANEELKQRLL
ncbi:MAG: alkylation response protein AidB-like acyl-CoA dehydrogenase, partial [Congregibacter sp.]